MFRTLVGSALLSSILSCKTAPAPLPAVAKDAPPVTGETHLRDVRQVTFGGENAEAYWSFTGQALSLQVRRPNEGCDRIYRMAAQEPFELVPVSSGKGATTCAHFLPGDDELIFASTHLGGEACPPKPDHSMGYVWALYDSYDIFRSRADGSGLTRLTETPGYDAEGTVCARDGSIVFTSVRDGDLELYRMDRDGKNVKRLTNALGYDGGAFFNRDCTKLVWRASRPRPGKELEDYQALLAKNLVRPSKLELYVANADGTDPVQVTYLNAASFAPFFTPKGDRILFSSNHGDPKGREFDIWAIGVDGTNLERITHAPGFDGFPMFSPDGKLLAFSSNRATALGQSDTNLFLARWVDQPPAPGQGPAERIAADAAWLAAPAREGRGVGTQGLEEAGAWLEKRFLDLGLSPAGDAGTFRQKFSVPTKATVGEGTLLKLGGQAADQEDFTVMGFSAQGQAKGELVLAGYGISDKEQGVDDYARVNVKGKIALVRRFVPDTPTFADTVKQRRFGDLRHKAWVAREHGARALVVVDLPEPPASAPADWKMPTEARLPVPAPEGPGDSGIPVLVVKRKLIEPHLSKLAKGRVPVELAATLTVSRSDAFNVVSKLGPPPGTPAAGVVVIGAHYDHLGLGGRNSLAPEKHEPHLGADDNASGTATLLEVARALAQDRASLKHEVLFIAFSGEETGVLGSTHFVRAVGEAGMKQVRAMLNMDMVGRLRSNRLSIIGGDSAGEWEPIVQAACQAARVECTVGGDGYGPSDQTPFYAAGAPVLHFFTGAHSDYHKPSDSADRLNAAGSARVAAIVAEVARRVADGATLTYRKVPSPAPRGDLRTFNASLGTIPDYAGPPGGQKGVLLSGVRPGGAAEKGGLRRGDVLVRLGTSAIGSVEDLMYVLNASKPGETVTAAVLRDGKEVRLEVTFQESQRR